MDKESSWMEMMDTFMKISEHLLKFPQTLPNDLETLMLIYPVKFPLIISYYEEVAKKTAISPEEFEKYSYTMRDELFAGFEKINCEYKNGNQDNLEFLVKIDQKLNKLYCYRFWVVNYLFADGPLHDFFVDNLKDSIRKFLNVSEDVEEFEQNIIKIQRDLLQSDYADLYLRQALEGEKLVELLTKNNETNEYVKRAEAFIKQNKEENNQNINKIWDVILDKIEADISTNKNPDLKNLMWVPLEQVKMRGSRLPFYNMMIQAIEFREENKKLSERYNGMNKKIEDIIGMAKSNLSEEEFEVFDISYKQARNFSMFKDVMGEIDTDLLPMWFGLHKQVRDLISKTKKIPPRPTGPASMFYFYSWYLPLELKDFIYTIDEEPFNLEKL